MKKTPVFILTALTAVIIFDFYIIFNDGSAETISAYIIRWSYQFPSIPFLVGFICGHLFWRMSDKGVFGDKSK